VRELRRQTLVFALLGVSASLVAVALFEPGPWGPAPTSSAELVRRVHSVATSFDWAHGPMLFAVGVGAGTLAGMLGMGGGVLKVAGMLVVFQTDILLARAVSLTTMFVATATAARVHIREGTVLWQYVRPMLVPALLAVIAGMLLGNILPRATLAHFFAFFVLFLGFNTLAQCFADPHEKILAGEVREELDARDRLVSRGIGAFHGFVCGLLGISGGVTAVPMQQTVARLPAANAIANAVVVSAFVTGLGCVVATMSGVARGDFQVRQMLFASFCIGGGALIGAQLGARLTGAIRVFYLKQMLALVSLCAGVAILFK